MPREGVPLEPKPPVAVTNIENQVQVKRTGSDTYAPASMNMELFTGDRVRTGPASFATLTYSNPEISKVKLYENTELEVEELQPDATGLLEKASINLSRGGAWAKIKGESRRKDFKFELKTPTPWPPSPAPPGRHCLRPGGDLLLRLRRVHRHQRAGPSVVQIKAGEGTRVLADAAPTMPASDAYILKDPGYEKEARYGWCIHCHAQIKAAREREQSAGCARAGAGSSGGGKPSSGGCD